MKLFNLCALLLFCSCAPQKMNDRGITPNEPTIYRPNYAVFEERLDGCEYLILDGSYAGGIIHKANCDNHQEL